MEPSHDLKLLLSQWRRQMAERGIADESTLDELESHLLDQVDELLEKGLADSLLWSSLPLSSEHPWHI